MLRNNPDLIIETVDGELIVLDTANEKVHKLNETAALIFQLCDGSRSLDQLTEDFCAHFDADQAVVEADLEQTLESFVGLGLLLIDEMHSGKP